MQVHGASESENTMIRRKVQYHLIKPRMQGRHGCNVRIIRLDDIENTNGEPKQTRPDAPKPRRHECNQKNCHKVDHKINAEMKLVPVATAKELERTKLDEESRQ